MRSLRPFLTAFGLIVVAAAAHAAPLAHSRHTLPNGAVLLVSEQRNVPMIVIRFLLDAGSRRDPAGKEGLANLTADLLTEGTKRRSASEISDAVDFIGASLGSGAGIDSAHVNFTGLSKDLETGLALMTEVLLQPSFPPAEIERRREAVLASMKASEDQPGYVASRAFTEFLFRGEPYGHLSQGTAAGVRAITRADIVAFYERNYRPERSIITVVGDIGAAQAVAAFEKALAGWKAGSTGAFEYPERAQPDATVIKIQKPVTQANIILGHDGIARDNPDYYALEVMNYILGGGGFGSRLMDAIRTKAGLAYSVGSGFSAPKFPGSFRVVLQTKNETAAQAVALACDEIERIRREPVTAEELSSAQLYLTGSFPLQLDSNGEIASFLTEIEFFDLGADYADTYAARINAITAQDVHRVATKYLNPAGLSLVAVADLEQAKVPSTPPCRQPAVAAEP